MPREVTKQDGEPMDIAAMLASAGIGTAVGIALGAVKSWHESGVAAKTLEQRVGFIKEELVESSKRRDGDLKETITELRAVVAVVAKLQGSQDVTNSMVARTLESISRRQDALDAKLNDVLTSHKLISDYIRKKEQ